MSVFKVLAREHRLFEGLLSRLERAFRYDAEAARGEMRRTLLILMPALARHERIEDSVTGAEGAGAPVEAQHRRIRDLLGQIRPLLDAPEGFRYLKPLVEELVAELRAHFRTEEDGQWPARRRAGRSHAATERRARRQVAALEKEIESNRELTSRYIGD